MRYKYISTLLAAAAFLFCVKAYGFLLSKFYRIALLEQASAAIGDLKTGGGYSLFGTTGNFNLSSVSSSRFVINRGVLTSWRPPELNLNKAHVYPNPCNLKYGCNAVTFTRLTFKANIKIYTVSGELVKIIRREDSTDSQAWDLKNEYGRQLSSGLYIYFIEGEGHTKEGKLVIVR